MRFFDSDKAKRKEKPKGLPRRTKIAILMGVLVVVLGVGIGVYVLLGQTSLMMDVPTANVIYAVGGDFYRHDLQTGERTSVPIEPGQYSRHFYNTPSPDGHWTANWELEIPDVYRNSHLIITGQDPNSEPIILGTFYGADETLSWSPDSQWIAFTAYDAEFDSSQGGHAAEIWMVHVETKDVKRLSTNAYLDSDPFFSPDGTQILYMSAADGKARMYIMDLATETSRLITPDQAGDYPRWSPDGKWAAFEAWFWTTQNNSPVYYPNIYVVRADGLNGQFLTYGAESATLFGWEP